MKQLRFLIFLFLFGSIALGLFGQNYQLIFLDGNADVRTNGQWVPLRTGDSVPGESSIRLADGSIAEFSGPQGTLLFSTAGTYELASTAAAQPKETKNSTVASIFNRLNASNDKTRDKSEVMGVRGSEAMEAQAFTWADEDSSNFEAAKKAFSEEDFRRTVEILENDVDPIVLDDEGAYWFYLAASYDGLGQMGKALKIVRTREVDGFSSAYPDFLFLGGRLAFESRNYEATVQSFESFIGESSDPGKRQFAYYLMGAALLEQEKAAEGKAALEEAVSIDADGEVTELAQSLIQ